MAPNVSHKAGPQRLEADRSEQGLITRMVYLGYVYDKTTYCPELVGVFATKHAAYYAVRKRISFLILDHWNLWAGDTRFRNEYHYYWLVKSVEPVT